MAEGRHWPPGNDGLLMNSPVYDDGQGRRAQISPGATHSHVIADNLPVLRWFVIIIGMITITIMLLKSRQVCTITESENNPHQEPCIGQGGII